MLFSLGLKNQSIDSSGITKDYKEALCEFIWNGFEANATEVRISHTLNETGGVKEIIVSDNGDGIDYNDIQDTFGTFLSSQKNSASLKIKSKINKGKGRFSFAAFSSIAEFDTFFNANGIISNFKITLSDSNKEKFEATEPIACTNRKATGTIVTFSNIDGLLSDDVSFETLEAFFLSEFSWYLFLNKHNSVKLYLNNIEIDYKKRINTELSESITKTIDNKSFTISLIVWSDRIKEKFRSYYFDSNKAIKGIDTTTFNHNTVDFYHSVFVESNFFDKWDNVSLFDFSDQICFNEPENKEKTLLKLKKEIQEFISTKISSFMSSKADKEIEKMITERKTFPVFTNDDIGEIRKKDLIRVAKELYCLEPRIFYRLKDVQEKSLLAFLNLLISSDERENILTVIDEIVKLSSEQRKQFANILQKTKLENIIDTISFIEKRYKVIEILKAIIYDFEKFSNERDHIQKIIEQNYWLFGEQYNLASADKTMYNALESYNAILYGAKNVTDSLPQEAEAERRMDIFLCSSRNVETAFGSYMEENLIVELKAPHITMNKTIVRQIEDYMDYIHSKPQFNSQQRIWKFVAVCKDVDEHVKDLYNSFKDRGKPGLIRQSDSYELYALTWDDIFKSFDIRHSFILNRLKYDRSLLIEELKINENTPSRETVNMLVKNTVT